MKKLFSTLIVFAIMIIGCGDETTVKGYTDEDVQNMFSIFKDSIVYIYKTDTVSKALDDTTMIRLIDSVYHRVESLSDENPRDTTITLSDTTELESGYTVVSKTWKGFVYKGVFYDTTAYQSSSGVSFPNRYYNDGTKYYCWHQCGSKIAPDFNSSSSGCWKTSEAMLQRFDGWRIFNFGDVMSLGEHLGTVISQDSIYIAHTTGVSSRSANYYRIMSNGEIVLTSGVKYLCAYDLARQINISSKF